MKYEFIHEHQKDDPLGELCQALEVTRSGYYQWSSRGISAREEADEQIKTQILGIHKRARGRYGHRPVYEHLRDKGLECGRDKTLRLMQEMDISGSQASRYKPLGTDSRHDYGYSPNLLKEQGAPSRIDQVWVADTTYLRVEGGWMYLATVMDLFSRRILGWSLSEKNDSELVCEALQNARQTRGKLPAGIIHHSDRGSTYAGWAYRKLLGKLKMLSSMSAKANCYDNAAMESFYGRFKTSTIGNRIFGHEWELRATVFEYIEVFYNRFRKHSSLGYQNPIEFEKKIAPMGAWQLKPSLLKTEPLLNQPTDTTN